MNYVGISCGFHDAGLSVIDDNGNILFAGHSQRYSMKKHDSEVSLGIVNDAHTYINDQFEVHYYERPYVKAIRQFFAKQKIGPLDPVTIIGNYNLFALGSMKNPRRGAVRTHNHHLCHAAAGFQTSPYQDATVVVIDAIGELDTISIWDAKYDKTGKATYKKIWGRRYPDSIGLFYSAMTARVGLRPLDEEYILMGMAAYGKPIHASKIEYNVLANRTTLDFKLNLHTGISDDFLAGANEMDIAASTQALTETLITNVIAKAKFLGSSQNLVYGGGVALNCLANRLLGDHFKNIWISCKYFYRR
jgi:carbamoyltransferase